MSDQKENDETPQASYEGGIPILRSRLSEMERKQAEAESRDSQYKDRQIALNKGLVIATVALVAATIALGSVQAWYMHRQWKLTSAGLSKMGDQIWAAKDSAYASKQASDTARDALVSVQRAFIQLNGFSVGGTARMISQSQEQDFFVVTDHLENSGATPAVGVVHYFRVQEFKREPTEQDFLPLKITTAATDVGPRGPLSLENIKPVSFYIGDNPSNQYKFISRKICLLGLVIYYDVFRDTKPHVTEFCKVVTGIILHLASRSVLKGRLASAIENARAITVLISIAKIMTAP